MSLSDLRASDAAHFLPVVNRHPVALREGKKPSYCLLDTGASGLHVSPSLARKAKLEPLSRARVFGGGGDGEHGSWRALVPRVALGSIVFRDALVLVAERELDASGRYPCLIGASRLDDYRIVLDPRRRRLRRRRWKPPYPREVR